MHVGLDGALPLASCRFHYIDGRTHFSITAGDLSLKLFLHLDTEELDELFDQIKLARELAHAATPIAAE